MRDHNEKIDRALRDFPTPPPPAGLLEKIQAEIPSGEVLAQESAPRAAAPSRWPLRLAATFVLAAVGATVAWQVVKSREGREFDRQAAAFQAPAKNEISSRSTAIPPPPPPPPPPAKAKPYTTGAESSSSTLAESFSSTDQLHKQVAQPLEIPEASYAVRAPIQRVEEAPAVETVEGSVSTELDDSSLERGGVGVSGGVVGGVAGGVPGGVAGGTVGGANAPGTYAPAAPKPAPKGYYENGAIHAEPFTLGEAGQVDVKSSASAATIPADSLERLPHGRELADESRERDREDRLALQATPDTMIFRETPANRFVSTDRDRLSTFALDVDTGSYTLTRGYLDRGILPPPAAIRVEEFVNAQQYDDPAPRPGSRSDFALYAEGAEAPFYPGERTRLLRFAVKAREIDARDRKPAVLTFVVDVSGSMDQENRLGLVKRALGLLLDELQPEDRVGLVVYGSEGRVLLRHTRDLEEIRRAIARLVPDGSTNAEEGLRLAYDLADEGWRQGAINKILLCSDGVANVGATGPESILARIGKEAQRGIELTTIGFGMGNYNDALMEQLADQGDGTYHYVDQLDEARKVFVENLTGTLETVAKEAKAQVEFDPEAVASYRLLGYENRDVADRDFRNDRIDAGELGAGHQATALYEVRLRDGVSGSDRIATLRLRWKSVAEKRVLEEAKELRARDLEGDWQDASANFHQAALAGAFAEKLKETAAADDFGWRSLRREAARLDDELRRRPSAGDLAAAIDRAARIAGVHAERDDRNRDDRRRDDDEDRRRNPRLDED